MKSFMLDLCVISRCVWILRVAAGRTSDAQRVIKPDVRTAGSCPRRLRQAYQCSGTAASRPHPVALTLGINGSVICSDLRAMLSETAVFAAKAYTRG